MRSESLKPNKLDLYSPARQSRFWVGALVLSVLLHGMLLGWVLTAKPAVEPIGDESPALKQVIQIYFDPGRRNSVTDDKLQSVDAVAAATQPEKVAEKIAAPTAADIANKEMLASVDAASAFIPALAEVSAVPAAEPEAKNSVVDLAEATVTAKSNQQPLPATATATATQVANSVDSQLEISAATISSAVKKFGLEQKQQQQQAWLYECLAYQKKYGVQDCPEQQAALTTIHEQEQLAAKAVFASVTRPQQHARYRRAHISENQRLQKLKDDAGPLGELAFFRYQLNREYVAYLSGNQNTAIWAYVQMSQKDNLNLPFMGAMLQTICDPSPCIWEYTPFRIQAPILSDSYVDESGELIEAFELFPYVPDGISYRTAEVFAPPGSDYPKTMPE